MDRNLERAAECISQWALSDSRVKVDWDRLVRALHDDSDEQEGLLPTEEECEQLVCGDEEGEVPGNLQLRFPRTHALLASHWE
jgi:hypothetical protein